MISEQNDTPYVLATITGCCEEEVTSQIEYYLSMYPVPGYRSEVIRPATNMGGDLWEAKIKRYASCE